jgi:hypothetical protein
MVVTYNITTPAMNDARNQAISLAKAQGYTKFMVLSIDQVEYGVYAVTLQVN